jgi:uncharacterized protein YegL
MRFIRGDSNRNQLVPFKDHAVSEYEYPQLMKSLRLNPELRTMVVILVDASGSMNEHPISQAEPTISPIDAVCRSLQQMKDYFCRNPSAAQRIEITIGTYASDFQVVSKMTPATDFNPPVLTAGGSTQMAEGMLGMLSEIKKTTYLTRQNGVEINPVVFAMLSDGSPTSTEEKLAEMSREFSAMYRDKLIYPIIAVTETGNARRLKELFAVDPIPLSSLKICEMFSWLSQSLASVSMTCVSPDHFAFPNPFEAKWSQKRDR